MASQTMYGLPVHRTQSVRLTLPELDRNVVLSAKSHHLSAWLDLAALFQRATTMKQFMWQPDLMRVAQIIDAGVYTCGGCGRLIQAVDQTSKQPGWLEQIRADRQSASLPLCLTNYPQCA